MRTITLPVVPGNGSLDHLRDFLRTTFLFHFEQAELAQHPALKELHNSAAGECKKTLSVVNGAIALQQAGAAGGGQWPPN